MKEIYIDVDLEVNEVIQIIFVEDREVVIVEEIDIN